MCSVTSMDNGEETSPRESSALRQRAASHPFNDEWLVFERPNSRRLPRASSEHRNLTQPAWSLVDSRIEKGHRRNIRKIASRKAPFKPKYIWALCVRLQMENRVRELAPLNLGIDSKLRGCDMVALKVHDVFHSDQVASRAVVSWHPPVRKNPGTLGRTTWP